MRLTPWLSAFGNFGFGRQVVRRTQNRGIRRAAISLEQLEDRALLSTFHVATDGDDTAAAADVTNATAYRSIQAAINAAAATNDGADEIRVGAGLYNTAGVDEKLSVPNSANLTDLVISGGWNATFTTQVSQTTTYIPTAPTPSGADGDVDINDDNTTITGIYFVFDGNGVGGTGGTRLSGGLVVTATGVKIDNNTIEIGGGNSGGRSTAIQTGSNDTTGLEITNNTITADGAAAGQGIFLNPGIATSTLIDGNTITGTSITSMIVVKERGNVTISNNTIQRAGAATTFQDIVVRSGASATPITNLVITGNTIDGGGTGTGIHIGDISGAGTQAITDFVITNNIISNHIGSSGIVIGGGASQPNVITGTIAFNSITGNTQGLTTSPLVGGGSTTVDASRNWWGDLSGPTVGTNPGGLGQTINDSTGIKFGPWLIYAPDIDPLTTGVQLPLIVTVTSGGDVSAADNDFTRLQNAVGSLAAGQTLDIQGSFNWTTANANASAAYLASINTSATNDIRGVELPANVDNLTITSTGSTAHIFGQGDLAGDIFDGFLFADDGVNTGNDNLTISNLNIDDFEAGLVFGWNVTGVFNGTTIDNNSITVGGDNEGTQNFGVYLTQGKNQSVTNNTITFQGDGTNIGPNGARSFGFQNTTTGADGYDGLLIDGNTFQVGATATGAETTFGIWENGHNDTDTSVISITNNSFRGILGGRLLDNALMLTSQSDAMTIDGNSFADVDNVFFARNASGGTTVGDEFSFSNNILTRVGGADGVFLRNVTSDDIHVTVNWAINNTVDGFTGVRGLNELSVQATGADRSTLTGASDLDSVNAIGVVTTSYVDDNFASTGRFTDPDGVGAGLGPVAVGFNTFDTIAAGIAATEAGGTVNVFAGTYAESPTLANNQTLLLAGAITVDSLDSLVGTTVDLQSFNLTLGNGIGDNTLAGVVQGAGGGLVKVGTDTLTLSGANTYTGTTAVNAGALLVNGSTTSATTVSGTLGGSGTIGAPVSIASGGILAPGNGGSGVLSTGNLSLVAGATLLADVNGTTPGTQADEVVVTGTVDLTGSTLSTSGTIASLSGQVITLIDNDGTDAVTGTFTGLPEGASVTINGLTFVVSYIGGTGNDVTLTETDVVVTINDVAANEGAGTLDFTVSLSKALDIDLVVNVTFTDGTATGGGTDYTSTTIPVTILAGQLTGTASVPLNDDNLVEATETFFASLSTNTALGGRTVSLTDTGIGSIIDNDAATVSIIALNDGAETNSPTNAAFQVNLSAPSSTDTVVSYTVGGTATSGSDYTGLSGTVTIPAGQTSAVITVTVLNDSIAEDTETVIVTLTGITSGNTAATLDVVPLNLTATVNITDDDVLTITSGATASVSEGTPATTVVINVDTNSTPGHTVVYTLSGPDAALFSIDPATGELRFLASPDFETPLDQGADNVYNVTVTATADFLPPKIATQDLTITVTNENEFAPVFVDSSPTFTIPENSPVGTVVGGVTATDADTPAQSVTYSIVAGNESGAFTIDPSTGVITVANSGPLNFEVTPQFTLTVRATDNGTPTPLSSDATVVVDLTNVEEGAVITIPNPNGTYHLGRIPAFVSPDATFTYDDISSPNYAGAQLTVAITAGRGKRDKLSIFRKGDGTDEIDVKGRRIYFNGELIGKSKGGRGRAHPDLVITFTSSASTAAVDNLVRRVNFQAKGDVGITRTVTMQVTNISGVDSNVATRDIAVVND